jgi:hypothetical protein
MPQVKTGPGRQIIDVRPSVAVSCVQHKQRVLSENGLGAWGEIPCNTENGECEVDCYRARVKEAQPIPRHRPTFIGTAARFVNR